MSHRVVKILTSDDGELRLKDLQFWHFVDRKLGEDVTLCEGELFGFGLSGCEYKEKTVKRGGITCPKCLGIIKHYKSIKL